MREKWKTVSAKINILELPFTNLADKKPYGNFLVKHNNSIPLLTCTTSKHINTIICIKIFKQ